jgi:membrane-bound ClpP family serine protease
MQFATAQFDARSCLRAYWNGFLMIALGVILIILALVLKTVHWLFTIGVILLVIGAVFWLLGRVGRPVAGRRYWY